MSKKYYTLLLLLTVFVFTGCSANSKGAAAAIAGIDSVHRKNAADASLDGISLDFKPGFNISIDEYKPLMLEINAPDYEINMDLSNIENLEQFPNLTSAQKELIARNGFVVSPTTTEQLFYIYEDNTYKKIPSFITVDSVLQLYHIFYDYSLRSLESDFFYSDLRALNTNMLKQLISEYEAADDDIRSNILIMIGYFGVSNLALGDELPSGFPDEIKEAAEKEYAFVEAAAGIEKSPLFGFDIDYSLFAIRGHYTRSGELERYFRAMSWYGIVPMPFYDELEARDEDSAFRAIITALALCAIPDGQGGRELWENIYSATAFYVGESDDITPYEIAEIIDKVYEGIPGVNEIKSGLDDFYLELEKMRKPEIVSKSEGAVNGPQMRFMGQRYIPDSEILQKLSEPYKRPFPTGVDVFAVFGSQRAEEILDEIYKPNVLWDEYEKNYNELKEEFRNQSIKEQTKNLYGGWLYSLKSLTSRVGEGYPLFMQNTAWEDKSLATALGSWAEIRHDTILYGKQSGAECGGGAEPPELSGYVEPNPEFFNRLLWLTECTKENFGSRGLLGNNMEYKLERFGSMLTFLRDCAIKELKGEDLSAEENYTLLTYGGTLEFLSSSIAEADNWFLVESDTDRHMAVVADIHTVRDTYLEVGVGAAAEIYVAIPQNGSVYLTRGAVFDFYEFVSDERLTDEAWQQLIKEEPPGRPPFTNSFMDEDSAGEIPIPEEPYSTGC